MQFRAILIESVGRKSELSGAMSKKVDTNETNEVVKDNTSVQQKEPKS